MGSFMGKRWPPLFVLADCQLSKSAGAFVGWKALSCKLLLLDQIVLHSALATSQSLIRNCWLFDTVVKRTIIKEIPWFAVKQREPRAKVSLGEENFNPHFIFPCDLQLTVLNTYHAGAVCYCICLAWEPQWERVYGFLPCLGYIWL